ncbi:MAG: hypothetical protein WAU49_08705 [Steroidobacteraceae bacterium]
MTTSASELRFRNLRTLAALAALFFMPLVASFWLYYGMGWRPGGRINHGELIQPPRPLPRVATEPALFHGEWTLVYIGDGQCDSACRETLYVMRQTRFALGTDMTRLAQVFLVTADCCAKEYLGREQAGIAVVDVTGAAAAPLLRLFPPGDKAHSVFIVDPLGNLMMRYDDVRRDPRGLLVDLKRLLELSQIG